MIEMTGDMFNTTAPALGHGVNVCGLMGAGIAVQFARLFPEMYRQYRALCSSQDKFHAGEVFLYQHPNYTIYNIASQDLPGRHAQMDWLEDGVTAALNHASNIGHDRIALPRIGCGIGGLDWNEVRPLLLDLEMGTGVELEVWTL